MKKHTKLLIIILMLIVMLVIVISNKIHYSKEKILSIINRSNETFNNIYIKTEIIDVTKGKTSIDEIYAKDNIIYCNLSSNFIPNQETEIWNIETKKKLYINHINKEIRSNLIEGERKSKSYNN